MQKEPVFVPPTLGRYSLPLCQGPAAVVDHGLYGLDIVDSATGAPLVQLSQEAELLLLELLTNKYPRGTGSEGVLVAHRATRLTPLSTQG